jgi:predicted thioesterase
MGDEKGWLTARLSGLDIVGSAMSEPAVNSTASAHLTVAPSDLASVLNLEPGDAFPPVFATSRMVGLMEVAAARILGPHLREGEASVGVSVDVVHTAATPPGVTVTATARFVGREGKLFLFEVSAADNAGEVGRGTHKRAIVSAGRLVAGATRRSTPA